LQYHGTIWYTCTRTCIAIRTRVPSEHQIATHFSVYFISPARSPAERKPAANMATAFVYEELYLWHEGTVPHSSGPSIQPWTALEHPEQKRRFFNLLQCVRAGAAESVWWPGFWPKAVGTSAWRQWH
jgi:hypothetical protein